MVDNDGHSEITTKTTRQSSKIIVLLTGNSVKTVWLCHCEKLAYDGYYFGCVFFTGREKEKIFIIFKQKSLVYVGSSFFYFLYRAFFSDMLKIYQPYLLFDVKEYPFFYYYFKSDLFCKIPMMVHGFQRNNPSNVKSYTSYARTLYSTPYVRRTNFLQWHVKCLS
ncbi:uncharacterized protein BX663DRAFT_485443 [Cokeromyces recurvatus]|uniref:uncharacterized protein n=1 Tax=Cokeromyces recurvatus TaxID=90255 RepID=UPI00221EBE7A|nr:uncharacterized protein BX663DRAFT_485443 [Cokeromyces recurvatus]KAI7903959.1 hypothetical protein BX663DRAFT_485443 [Cokeromyces recurvatus]